MRTSSSVCAVVVLASSAAFGQSRGTRITSQQETTSKGTGMFEQIYAKAATRATTTTEILRGRFRLEVIEGTMTGVPVGQYTLQDTLDFLMIDPATRTFTRFNFRELPDLGSVSVRTDSLMTTMDSAQVMDSVTGTMAMRYSFRFSQSMVASINSSALPAGLTVPDTRTTMASTYEFWYAIGGNDLPSVNLPPRTPTSELAASMREMFSRLPRKRPIRSVTISRMEGDGGTGERRSTTLTAKIDTVTMDDTRFVLPAGYTERSIFPGRPPADSAWLARWRLPPG